MYILEHGSTFEVRNFVWDIILLGSTSEYSRSLRKASISPEVIPAFHRYSEQIGSPCSCLSVRGAPLVLQLIDSYSEWHNPVL